MGWGNDDNVATERAGTGRSDLASEASMSKTGSGAIGSGADTNSLSDYNLYLPSILLVTGYYIIFFWVSLIIIITTHCIRLEHFFT